MRESPAFDSSTASLLPGFRFYPSEDQLFEFYLLNKNTSCTVSDDCNLIRELDLYSYLPFELPDLSRFPYGRGGRKRHWYCFVIKTLCDQRSRRAKGGFWRRTGRVKDVLGGRGGKVVLGTRTRFVFYLWNSQKAAIRSDWIMYEYALVNHNKDSFVLCRVFIKPRSGNSTSDKLTRSYADKTAVRVPNKGHVTPESATPLGVVSELNNCAYIKGDLDSRFHPDSQLGYMVRSSVPIPAGQISMDAVAPHELASILEGDYIELDDLLGPFPGVD